MSKPTRAWAVFDDKGEIIYYTIRSTKTGARQCFWLSGRGDWARLWKGYRVRRVEIRVI